MKIQRRKYASKAKQVRKAIIRIYTIINSIKREHGLSDDNLNYARMKKDLVRIALETRDLTQAAERVIREYFKHN